jgi:hypothetical protein
MGAGAPGITDTLEDAIGGPGKRFDAFVES